MQEGIKHQNIVAYMPQQKGVAEQMNHTIMEHVTIILNLSGLDNGFWEESSNIEMHMYLKYQLQLCWMEIFHWRFIVVN